MRIYMLIPIIMMVTPYTSYSQDTLFQKLQGHVSASAEQYQTRVEIRSQKALSRLEKEEKNIQKKLWKIDSVAAKRMCTDDLKSRFNNNITSKIPGSGYLDTLQLSLQFLHKENALKSIQSLQGKLQQAEEIQAYINNRKQELIAQLSQYTAIKNNLQAISKEAYYYQQQLKEYKQLFHNRDKATKKAIETLKKLPAYNNFISQHSQLAYLFNLGANYNSLRNVDGLQSRLQVEQLVQQRLGDNPTAAAALNQQMGIARDRFNDFKSKFPELDNTGQMPDFKPNSLKTKPFLQRLEYGGNIQFKKTPATSDIAGQVAYKFQKKGSIGVGVSYKLGLGAGWNHIALSHQGIGIRSFIDWEIVRTFYLTGGFEKTYTSGFNQSAALLGLSKKYKINAKVKGNLQLLYDFLSPYPFPNTKSINFRFGYLFNNSKQ